MKTRVKDEAKGDEIPRWIKNKIQGMKANLQRKWSTLWHVVFDIFGAYVVVLKVKVTVCNGRYDRFKCSLKNGSHGSYI